MADPKTQYIHGHSFGELLHPNGDVTIDDEWVDSLQEGFRRLTQHGYYPPVLRAHEDDEGKGKEPRPVRDGFAYGAVVDVVDSRSQRADALREGSVDTPQEDGVWFGVEMPPLVVEAQEQGLIKDWSPSFYRDWQPPHPEMNEGPIRVAPRHLAFVSIPYQKDLETSSPLYEFTQRVDTIRQEGSHDEMAEIGAYELGEADLIEADPRTYELRATEHVEWPVASTERGWDGSEARQAAQEELGIDDGDVDELPEPYVKMHLVVDEEDVQEGNISGGKFPVARPIDGQFHYVPAAAVAANQALGGAREDPDISNEEMEAARRRLDKIYASIHAEHDSFPESIEASEPKEFAMDEQAEEKFEELTGLISDVQEEICDVKDDVADLQEEVDAGLDPSEEDGEDGEDPDPELQEKIESLQEDLEAKEDRIDELQEERDEVRQKELRRSIEMAGFEDDEEIEEMLELADDDEVEFSKRLAKRASEDFQDEVGFAGNPNPDELSESEKWEQRDAYLEDEYDVTVGSKEYFQKCQDEFGELPAYREEE